MIAKHTGKDLKIYLNRNKGDQGGYVFVDSPAGKTAKAFNGSKQKVTNWTTLEKNLSFNPKIKNRFGVNSDPTFC